MQYEEIEVFISAKGEVKMEVKGVRGDKCESVTDEFIQSLGGDLVEHERTTEYYEDLTESAMDQQRLGDC